MNIKFIKDGVKHSIDVWAADKKHAINMMYALTGSKYFLIAMA